MYKGKSVIDMSEEETNQMLEDLIWSLKIQTFVPKIQKILF